MATEDEGYAESKEMNNFQDDRNGQSMSEGKSLLMSEKNQNNDCETDEDREQYSSQESNDEEEEEGVKCENIHELRKDIQKLNNKLSKISEINQTLLYELDVYRELLAEKKEMLAYVKSENSRLNSELQAKSASLSSTECSLQAVTKISRTTEAVLKFLNIDLHAVMKLIKSGQPIDSVTTLKSVIKTHETLKESEDLNINSTSGTFSDTKDEKSEPKISDENMESTNLKDFKITSRPSLAGECGDTKTMLKGGSFAEKDKSITLLTENRGKRSSVKRTNSSEHQPIASMNKQKTGEFHTSDGETDAESRAPTSKSSKNKKRRNQKKAQTL